MTLGPRSQSLTSPEELRAQISRDIATANKFFSLQQVSAIPEGQGKLFAVDLDSLVAVCVGRVVRSAARV
jgi:hypothetical protein